MPDTYTSSLRIVQQVVGGNENTWGTILNAATAMLDEGIAGQVSVSVTAGNVTLSTANNATDQSRPALLILTGAPGTTRTVTFPDVKKLTNVFNNTTDGSAITCTAGAGTTVTIQSQCKALVYTDGATNCALISHNAWTPIVKAADEGRASTAVLADDGTLTVPITSGKNYLIRGVIFFKTTAIPGFKYGFNGPTASRIQMARRHGADASTPTLVTVDNSFPTPVSLTGGSNTGGVVAFDCMIRNATSGTSFAFQWSQDTSNGTSTVVEGGSYIEVRLF